MTIFEKDMCLFFINLRRRRREQKILGGIRKGTKEEKVKNARKKPVKNSNNLAQSHAILPLE